MSRYVIYVDWGRKVARIHRADCPNVRAYGGVSSSYPPSGWYIDGLADLRTAEWVAGRQTGLTPDQHECPTN